MPLKALFWKGIRAFPVHHKDFIAFRKKVTKLSGPGAPRNSHSFCPSQNHVLEMLQIDRTMLPHLDPASLRKSS
jgi:hypothetical protein